MSSLLDSPIVVAALNAALYDALRSKAVRADIPAVIEHLSDLAEYMVEPECKVAGICAEIRNKWPAFDYAVLAALMLGWPEHSGDAYYPVEGEREDTEATVQDDCWDKHTDNGQKRRRLCDYIANQLQEIR
jgi:hypothetical protein